MLCKNFILIRDLVESLKKGKFAPINIGGPVSSDPSINNTATTTSTTITETSSNNNTNIPSSKNIFSRVSAAKRSLKESRRIFKELDSLFNPKHQQLRMLTKSGHSEMVKQFFGRNSAYFIGIIILYFYFHLMWLYGSVEHDLPLTTISNGEQFWFRFAVSGNNMTNLSGFSEIISSNGSRTSYINVQFASQTNISKCQLFNLNNRLPFFVLAFDLFILLLTETAKIVCVVLLLNFYLRRVRAQITADAQKLQNRYLLVNCVLAFSVIFLSFDSYLND